MIAQYPNWRHEQTGISTPDGRLRAMREIRRNMYESLDKASNVDARLRGKDRIDVLEKVDEIRSIRYHVAGRAQELGYARLCRESIPVCNGECCRWHFPKGLDYVDFLVVICGLGGEERKSLARQITASEKREYQCPVLGENGCSLSFENRPIVCATAYPCFVGPSYWSFLAEKRKRIGTLYVELKRILEKYI